MTVRIRATLLILWGWTALWSLLSGRLDLLLRSVFHGLVGAAGIALLTIGALMLVRREHGQDGRSRCGLRRGRGGDELGRGGRGQRQRRVFGDERDASLQLGLREGRE